MLAHSGEVVETFGGPGGWGIALAVLGIPERALEIDPSACATRAAAGLSAIQADVASADPRDYAGAVGHVSSPPCPTFSQAGAGIGRETLALIVDGIRAAFAGEDMREEIRQRVYPVALERRCEDVRKKRNEDKWPRAKLEAAAHRDAALTALVIEPARWIHALSDSLRWVAMEQVPPVLPLWRVYQAELRALGWSCWTGLLEAADYGVPQTRTRAILIARLDGPAVPPEPTHSEHGGDDLFGGTQRWVSMSAALGWGMTARPYPTIASGRTTGGPDKEKVGGSRDREAIYDELDAGRWVLRNGSQANACERPIDQPAGTLFFGQRLNDGVRWHLRAGAHAHATERSVDEPAPTLAFGHAAGDHQWIVNTGRDWKEGGSREDAQSFDASERPAPTIDGKGRWHVEIRRGGDRIGEGFDPAESPAQAITSRSNRWQAKPVEEIVAERANDQTGTAYDPAWPAERPSTTIASRGLATHPGANNNRFNEATKSRNDGIRITLEEAAALQSFPDGYPWQGNRSSQFRQVGDAVPPLLALAVLRAAALGDPSPMQPED